MTEKKSFWATLPGILTAMAAFLTAVGGLIVALSDIGILDLKKNNAKALTQTEASKPNYSPILKDQLVAKFKDSGKKHFDSGKYKDAVSDFEEALKLKPGDAWTLRYLADSYRGNEQQQLAMTTINHSIQLDPGNAYSYKVRGLLFYAAYQYEKAIADFEKVLSIEPDNVWSITRLADSYQNRGNYKLALEYVNRAIELDSADAFSYKVRGQIYYKFDRYNDAISDFKRVLEIEPNNAWSIEYIQKVKEKMK